MVYQDVRKKIPHFTHIYTFPIGGRVLRILNIKITLFKLISRHLPFFLVHAYCHWTADRGLVVVQINFVFVNLNQSTILGRINKTELIFS